MVDQKPAKPNRPRQIAEREASSEQLSPDLDPVLDRVYRNRGLKHRSELDYSLSGLYPPQGLSGLDDAVEIIIEALQADARIVVAGDYDADGATGCSLGCLALRAFGSRNTVYAAPDRNLFGYGLTVKFVRFLSEMQPDLIITVDNGIGSVDGIKLANQMGITVIVTDHHLPGEIIPSADAIVNPRMPGDQFKSKNLAGVGVLFYVLSVVRSKLVQSGWFEREGISVPNMADYLDLVAVGTVADVVPLDYNNRILVQQGLDRINAGRCRYGIRLLLELGGRKIGKIVAEDLAFQAGPRLNAAGRLGDITVGIQCLVGTNRREVENLVTQLNSLNIKRQEMQRNDVEVALKVVEQLESKGNHVQRGHCLYKSEWHLGIVGLLAQKVRDETGKPTIAFAPADAGLIRGSCRSVPEVNIRDLLANIAINNPDLILVFGGHAMAAGLTLKEESFLTFKTEYEDELARLLGDKQLDDTIHTDGKLEIFDLKLAQMLREGGPWGQGFPAPQFEGVFKIEECEPLVGGHLKFRVQSENNRNLKAIYFGFTRDFEKIPNPATYYRMVFKLELNEFHGQLMTQLRTIYMEPV